VAVTKMCGFEGGHGLVDDLTLTGVGAYYSSSAKRTGTYSIRCNPASGASAYVTFSTAGPGHFHFGLYVSSRPTVTRVIFHAVAAGYVGLKLTSTGALECWVDGSLIGTTAAIATGQWHWIGVRDKTSASDLEWMQVNGVGQGFLATKTISTNIAYAGFAASEASTADIFIDDLIVDDANFLAPSKVALLLPISDNARATLWTGGTGGTTNLYDAVNNTPPIGSATESNTTQIEHAGSAAGSTDAYDANMTTYTTAGVGASDTLLALQGIVAWGEDISTGTKLLSYGGISNPAWTGESSIDVSTGHGSGAVGTYATGADYWNERRSAIAASPSVTLGTSPVMRVLRPETASRVASVCFMGMYVAWTPYVAPPADGPPIQPKVYPQLIPH